MLFFTFGVANVYRIGFIAELMGRTNTAIQAAKSLGGLKFFSKSDLIPNTMIGIQQRQSVKMMKNSLLARPVSLLVLADWFLTRTLLMNMAR